MESLNTIPFVPEMPVFSKLGELAETATMTATEYQAYQDSVDAYRTTMASLEYHEKVGKLVMAKNLKAEGVPVNVIVKCSGLSEEEINSL